MLFVSLTLIFLLSATVHTLRAPTVTLSDGNEMPVLGLGTAVLNQEEAYNSVTAAINAGYRLIDGALRYQNERAVGKAIKDAIKARKVTRKELFVTTKLWDNFHHPDRVRDGLYHSLFDLKLNYVDLYLIHWPFGIHDNGTFSNDDFLDTYAALENLVREGLVKSIGVSNFNKEQLDKLLTKAIIKPVVNQIEVQPYFQNKELVEYTKSLGIKVTAYSPLGGSRPPYDPARQESPLKNAYIKQVADREGYSVAQMILKYLHHQELITIPRSSNASHVRENIAIFDSFKEFPSSELEPFKNLDTPTRICPRLEMKTHKDYPFKEIV
jgi:aldehyde reductase